MFAPCLVNLYIVMTIRRVQFTGRYLKQHKTRVSKILRRRQRPCELLFIWGVCMHSVLIWTSEKKKTPYLITTELRWRSRYSDWLRAGRTRGRNLSPGRVKNVHFSISSRLAMGFASGLYSSVESWDCGQKSRKLVVNVSTEVEDISDDTADWEGLIHAVVNCRVCEIAMALYFTCNHDLYVFNKSNYQSKLRL
jgi:hypothetical protein